MTEERELHQKRMDEQRQYAKDVLDIQFKGVGYLLAANAAGLAGCVTLVKDYATAPQLKGVGIFICLFGLGFISAVMAFLGTVSLQQGWLGAFLGLDATGISPKSHVAAAIVPCVLSCLLLCAAVAFMIVRFVRLSM
jgi:hypothetical protein